MNNQNDMFVGTPIPFAHPNVVRFLLPKILISASSIMPALSGNIRSSRGGMPYQVGPSIVINCGTPSM